MILKLKDFQKLTEMVMANPANRQRYAEDEIFRAMVDNRMKHFDFQVAQNENAQIGRVGAKPVLAANAG